MEHGSDMLGNTCNSYPRIIKKVNYMYYETGHLSCPEIARLVLVTKTPFEWIKTKERDLKKSVIVPSYFSGDNIYTENMEKYIIQYIMQRKYDLSQRIWLIGIF
ncbi:hypothetical protein ID856_20175, partial [Xenorhabdus sp. 18]|nr:hypothetical protein [Xenorhabdus sp. 18]